MLKNLPSLLLKNIGVRQTILKNTFWLVFSEIIARVLGLIMVIYIARILGATEYGKFTFAFSFTSILGILSGMGISDISTREFSRSKNNEKKLSSILGLQIVLSFVALLIAFFVSIFITLDTVVRQAIWILAAFAICNNFFSIIFSFMRGQQKMEYEAGIKLIQSLANLAVVFFVIFNIPSVVNLSYAYFLSNIAILAVFFVIFNLYFKKTGVLFSKELFSILKISWPLTFGLMISWIYISLNSVMLGYFGFITENGWYNAAARIVIVAILPASLIVKSFYPALSNFYIHSKQNLQKAWNLLVEIMILLAFPTVIGGIALSDKIISALYGFDFIYSSAALKLLLIAAGISFINYPYTIILVISDRQKKNFTIILIGVILNIFLNVFLIPRSGFYGAIASTIISSFLVFILTLFFVKRLSLVSVFSKDLFKTSIISFGASMAMYFSITEIITSNWNILLSLLLGLSVYIILIAIFYRYVFPQKFIFLKLWKNP